MLSSGKMDETLINCLKETNLPSGDARCSENLGKVNSHKHICVVKEQSCADFDFNHSI